MPNDSRRPMSMRKRQRDWNDDGYSGPVGVCTIGTTSSSSSIVAVTDDSAVGSEPR